jgi:putative sigma-54 modulation protein
MKIHVHAVHFDIDPKLVGFIQNKLNKLETFYDKFINGEVFLKLDKGENSKIHKKHIEVKLNVPGHIIFAEEKGSTFEEATDLALEALKAQIKKFKDKKNEVEHKKQEIVTPAEELVEDDF